MLKNCYKLYLQKTATELLNQSISAQCSDGEKKHNVKYWKKKVTKYIYMIHT